jgi:catechol 2,3-dioxygenase-like lactoylglutathione lyase family enzyme
MAENKTMTIIRPHKASFEVFPEVKRGEVVEFFRIDSENPAWFYGQDSSGREGYLPKDFFNQSDCQEGKLIARCDYSARELTVSEGQEVELLEEYGDWIYARVDNQVGWIPKASVFNSSREFEVDQIDHVELLVPDREAAARWYAKVLGLRKCAAYAKWADDHSGPLMMETANAGTKLALFEDKTSKPSFLTGYRLVAFRVSGEGFLRLLDHLAALSLITLEGTRRSTDAVTDHGLAFSGYLKDLYGNAIEVTTYEHEQVRSAFFST